MTPSAEPGSCESRDVFPEAGGGKVRCQRDLLWCGFWLAMAAMMAWMFARSNTVPWGAPWGNHLKTLWFLGRTFSFPLFILYFAFAGAARTRGLPLPPRAIACGLGFLVCLACMAGEYFSRGEYYGVNDPWEYTFTIAGALGASVYFFLRWIRGRKIRVPE